MVNSYAPELSSDAHWLFYATVKPFRPRRKSEIIYSAAGYILTHHQSKKKKEEGILALVSQKRPNQKM